MPGSGGRGLENRREKYMYITLRANETIPE